MAPTLVGLGVVIGDFRAVLAQGQQAVRLDFSVGFLGVIDFKNGWEDKVSCWSCIS